MRIKCSKNSKTSGKNTVQRTEPRLNTASAPGLAPSGVLTAIKRAIEARQLKQAEALLRQTSRQHPLDMTVAVYRARLHLIYDQPAESIKILEQVLSAEPAHHEGLLAFADLALQQRDIALAAEAISKALEYYPDDAEVLHHAGLIHLQADNEADALICFTSALSLQEDNISVLTTLANHYLQKNQWRQAYSYLECLCRIDPRNASSLLGLGTACLRLGDYQAAEAALVKSLRIDGNNLKTIINLGATYRMTKNYAMARQILLKALQKAPHNAEVLSVVSSLYVDLRNYEKGLDYARKALKYSPDNPESYIACAFVYGKRGEYREAERMYQLALTLNPTHKDAAFGLGCVLLVQGQFHKGWEYYRARFDLQQTRLDGPWPIWRGEDLTRKCILVRTEQGYGDTIQFIRFLPRLNQLYPVNILLLCPLALRRLLEPNFKEVRFLSPEHDMGKIEADYQTALMDLPEILGVDNIHNIPARCPYLTVGNEEKKLWALRLPEPKDAFKIGIVWAGNPKHMDDHNRSIPIEFLTPIFDIENIQVFSFQVGKGADELKKIFAQATDFTSEFLDFHDTAALMTHMDVMISVDTAPIHLAGALNIPGVVLLPFTPDWRWLLKRQDSPWYPSLRLFRQPTPGDWQPVIIELVEYIRQLMKNTAQRAAFNNIRHPDG